MITEQKKKKITGSLPGVNVTVHTGDPDLDIKQFNHDADAIPAPIAGSNAVTNTSAASSAGNTGDCAGGACGESLSEDVMYAARLDLDVELPPHIHLIDESLVKAAIKKVEPEEEFSVGYVTPVYFYKDLWDKFTLFKCTEMVGWTGEDYIEARADTNNSAQRIDLAKKQTTIANNTDGTQRTGDHEADDGGSHNNRNPIAGRITDYSANYTLVNKIVAQPKGETLLFYPVVGSRPKVVYYIDMKNGNGPVPCNREDLEATIYKKVVELAKKKDIKERYVNRCLEKVRDMLSIDAATISAVSLDDESKYETRSRFDNGNVQHHVQKPQVRALYLQQLYFLETKDKTLGKHDSVLESVANVGKQELTEKRETKRYYIRPQDIFCANKADVLKGLIDVANSGENCTVYSLKNLSDHDDVHKLTNHDIIYYYDDNVLYDKNHVLVMDYDLFIKHEEERKKINKDPVALTKTDYDQNYDDRMTKETVVEGMWGGEEFCTYGYRINNVPESATKRKYIVARLVDDELWFYGSWDNEQQAQAVADELNSYNNGSYAKVIPNTTLPTWDNRTRTFTESFDGNKVIPFKAFKLAIERGEEVDLGYNQADVDVMFVRDGWDTEPYADTAYTVGKDNNGYYMAATLNGADGASSDGDTKYYHSFEDLINAIKAQDWSTGELNIELINEANQENPFEQSFESYDIFGNRLTEAKDEKKTCCICGEEFVGYGNNAEPYKKGTCCNACNIKFVIPSRVSFRDSKEEAETEEKEEE